MAKNRNTLVIVKPHQRASCVRTYEADGTFFEESLSEFFDFPIDRVVLRDNAISFDWMLDDDDVETVRLTSRDGMNFQGRSINSPGTNWESTAPVEAVLYSNAKGHVLVAQTVYEDGVESWIVRFYNEKVIDIDE